MEKVIKEVVYSRDLFNDLKTLYVFGLETFGETMASLYQEKILHLTHGLSFQYHHYPECKYLSSPSQIYRNIVLDKYLIVYRVRKQKVEVLRVYPAKQHPSKIKSIKKIKPK